MVKNLYHKSKIQPATLERTSHAKLEKLYFLGKQSFINCDFFFFFFFNNSKDPGITRIIIHSWHISNPRLKLIMNASEGV